MSKEFQSWGQAHAYAEWLATETRFACGIEPPTQRRSWTVKMLPRSEHRFGWELRCEVVEPKPRPAGAP
jgi:hypothetical protein